MTAHGPTDPMCCPTQNVLRRFTVKDDRLAYADASPQSDPQLVGTLWHWVRTRYGNDTQAVPARPENYTVRFLDAGKLDAKADCNRKGGTYSLSGRRLIIRIINSTMGACEADSLEGQFMRDLTGAADYFFRDADLYIDIKSDTGTMMFTRGNRQ